MRGGRERDGEREGEETGEGEGKKRMKTPRSGMVQLCVAIQLNLPRKTIARVLAFPATPY